MTALKTTVCAGCGARDLEAGDLRDDGGHNRIGLTFDIDGAGNLISEIMSFPVPPCPGPIHTSIG